MQYRTEVYTDKYQDWMDFYNPSLIMTPYGSYYRLTYEKEDLKTVRKHLKRRHLRSRTFQKRWDRSSNYRKQFFAANPPPYKCRYCGKPLDKDQVQIDHIIPVAKTKYSSHARDILEIRGIHDVNDVRNLAPCCRKCNARKESKMGVWLFKAWLGNHDWYWKIRRPLKIIFCIVIAIFLAALIYFAYVK